MIGFGVGFVAATLLCGVVLFAILTAVDEPERTPPPRRAVPPHDDVIFLGRIPDTIPAEWEDDGA